MPKARRGAGRAPARGAAAGKSRSRAGPGGPPARLWAPWRMEFVLAPKEPGCIFCRFPAEEGEANDRRNLVVHRSARSFTVLNRYPYSSGHVMVIPRRHTGCLEDLTAEEFQDLHEELRLAARLLREVYRPDGMNLGMNLGRIAGAGIADHLHYHVVPRWAGDTNFMPVLAETRVLVEHLHAAWEKIQRAFRERSAT